MKRLLNILLTLLGCSFQAACMRCEYGTPNITFELKARVVDEQGMPIEGIEVRALHGQDDKHGQPFDNRTGISDYRGEINAGGFMWPGVQYNVRFIDPDGELNGGEFTTLEMEISDKVEQVKEGDGNWNEGSYRADLGDVTMTLAQEDDNIDDNDDNDNQ